MIIVEDYEAIRRAYYLEKKSIWQIAREQHHSRKTIRKAIGKVQPQPYQLRHPKPAPIFGSFQHRVDEFLTKNKSVVRYTERGTYTGNIRGTTVTEKPFQTTGITIFRHAADGKIVEIWGIADTLGVMQQLGVIPALGQAS